MTDKELTAKVDAVNRAHAYAMQLWTELTEFFRPYVGTAVETKGGSLMAKIQAKFPTFPHTNELMVCRHVSSYSLAWTVRASTTYPTGDGYSSAVYYETTIYIGDLSGQTLTKLCESYQEPPNLLSDYTVEKVLANQAAAKQAKKAYETARDKCYPFGE
jgi:hypothetical protein